MSDLGRTSLLQPASTQLDVDWYIDPTVHQREIERLFRSGPNYVGHRLVVPEIGDYHVLDQHGRGQMLIRNAEGVQLMSNVCRHRQAEMLSGRGNTSHIVCPLHRWTYDTRGQLLGAPHFAEKPCVHLDRQPLEDWNGLLFAGPRPIAQELAAMRDSGLFNFDGYVLDHVEVTSYPINWKTFIEVYLEDYHVVPFHPGLAGFVDCDRLAWTFGTNFCVQTVGVKRGLKQPGSQVYGQWHEQVLARFEGAAPPFGAVWLTVYPNLMVEWYPHVLVISHIQPDGPLACRNVVEFYYPEEIAAFEREFVEAERAAYRETAIEDEEICIRMDRGRRALHARGISQVGPYQSPYEDGMVHFHEYLRRELA